MPKKSNPAKKPAAAKKIAPAGTIQKSVPELSQEQLCDLIQKKAYELYEKRGRKPGYEFEDWLVAEKLVKKELKNQ